MTAIPRSGWTNMPVKQIRRHDAEVYTLVNHRGWTVVTCRCGWAMTFAPRSMLGTARRAFDAHVTAYKADAEAARKRRRKATRKPAEGTAK